MTFTKISMFARRNPSIPYNCIPLGDIPLVVSIMNLSVDDEPMMDIFLTKDVIDPTLNTGSEFLVPLHAMNLTEGSML